MKRTAMKRKTPLKSSGNGLRRTAMKPGRKRIAPRRAEPREWEDKPARVAYLFANPVCRLCPVLRPGELPRMATCLHHALGRGWIGADTPANFCPTCDPCHEEVGRHNPGKVVTLYAQFVAGQLDLSGLAGVGYSVIGKVENWIPVLPERERRWAEFLVEFAKSIPNP